MSVIYSRWSDQAAGGQRQFERGRATGTAPDKAAAPVLPEQKAPVPAKPKA
jgi:hypothetical protein